MLLGACNSVSTVTKEDLSFLYDRNATKLRLPARVHNLDTSKAQLHFRLHTNDLLYRRGGKGDPFATLVKVRFDTYDANDRKILLDSAQLFVTDLAESPESNRELYGVLPMKRYNQKRVLVIIKAHDLYRDIQSVKRFEISPTSGAENADFLLIDPERKVPFLSDNVNGPKKVKIEAPLFKGQKLQGAYLPSDESVAPPIFSTKGIPAIPKVVEESFDVLIDEYGMGEIEFMKPGIYSIRPANSETGLSVKVLGKSFPEVSRVDNMIAPLRYITSKQEFERIKTSKNKRAEVERLWKDLSGNRDRARQVIRAYYNRVENANVHFTSHKEGWRTDRGLVHIVFGIPNTIHRSSNSETWVYGEESSLLSMTFVFVKQSNPFSENDLRLRRDPSFKSAWYRNVESWRNGRIYEQ